MNRYNVITSQQRQNNNAAGRDILAWALNGLASLTMVAAMIGVLYADGPVAVTLSPTTVTLTPSQSYAFTATVTGAPAGKTGVTWSLSTAVGSISSTGVYTAPASVTTSQTVQVIATSVANATKSATATVTLSPGPVTVSLSPTTVTLTPSQSYAFTATVTGAPAGKTGVTWSLSSAVGSISSTGVYTAPASVTASQTVQVIATSVANTTKSATATVTLNSTVSVSLSSVSGSLMPSQTQTLTATVTGTTNQGVTWTLSPALGTIAGANTAVYTAPSSIAATQTVQVTATSMADTTKFARILLTLVPGLAITVNPLSADLTSGQSQQFTATVTGAANQTPSQAATWTISPSVGTVSTSGTYTAPTTIAADQTITLTAQSAVDTSAYVKVPVRLHRPEVQYTFDDTSLTSLTYNGQSFYTPVTGLVEGGLFRSPTGVVTSIPWYSPSQAIRTLGPNYFQHVYNSGQRHQFTVKVTWSLYDYRTLKVNVAVTNGDPTDSLAELNLLYIPLRVPGVLTGQTLNNGFAINQTTANAVPAGFLNGTWGSAAIWQDYPSPTNIWASYNQTGQTVFDFAQSNYVSRVFSTPSALNGSKNYESPIAPGATQNWTAYLRFGTATDTVATLAPEAFSSYQTAFPDMVNWPDRRPIGTWFVSEGTDRTAINPRGYLWNPSLNVSNSSGFQSSVLAQANSIVTRMNAMTPKPQGIILWDLEGQEFVHAMTYIGHPDDLPVLAPEMDAVADQVFSTFTAAGYRVGVTIRPQTFGTGTSLPSTCTPSTNYVLSDKTVLLTATPPYRGYVCSAPNTWTLAPLSQPYEQVWTDDDTAILTSLENKISYAQQRWGATLFYIDSDCWVNGDPIFATIFRTLAQMFPNVLLIPETTRPYHFGAAAPYLGAKAFSYYGTPAQAKTVYPSAFSVIDIGNLSFTTAISGQLAQSVSTGDILLFPAWYAAPEVTATQQIYATAATLP